jgi:hypothetical protein
MGIVMYRIKKNQKCKNTNRKFIIFKLKKNVKFYNELANILNTSLQFIT